ncbi:sigma-E factor regulatory protein RseB domain-containing protein [Streptomyces sp. NPDC045431]|uniref:LolA family protein n=1 Tax=Streptomyces sp. NPDC045431 TaxID=3155613 RepID=UPI0033F32D0B
MAPNDSAPNESAGRRTMARYAVPVAVAGVAAATIGLVPALAAAGDPELPEITAQQLVEKIAASDVQRLSGTVKVTADLGLPSLGALGGAGADESGKLMELASGTHTLRVAADGPDKQRLTFVDDAAEYSLIRNGKDVWAYDGASKEAVHSSEAGQGSGTAPDHEVPATPKDLADQALKAVDDTTSVTVDGTSRIAGRDAYQLLIKPKQSDAGSTIGSIRVAVDAEKGVPLKFTLTPSDGGKAAIDVGFTKVDFGTPAASTFALPQGAKVTEAPQEAQDPAGEKLPEELAKEFEGLADLEGGLKVIGEGWTTVASLNAPGGEAAADGKAAADGEKAPAEKVPAEAGAFLDALGDKVSGKFGTGTVFKTRLVNALLTDDGRLYAGAVTPEKLLSVANAEK